MKIEEALTRLGEITKRLEAEDLLLEEALSLFEEGVALAARVRSDLDQARLRIRKVIETSQGTLSLEDFDLS
jgi:exodeoxyribonuclease VII small subunit